ncbi:penicillin-insensitive murein endopeptidase [Enterovirga sp.]|jgi:penicillin-insensitive murein endopeptidase|uniref:penicillin-insensitive murein endopeptidase n=1 Tax=Enterovirga sp. TaxID=2026350 RepID=UPI00262CDB4C|nr:penicillin-insensitive murein endopeptidase [Enterovirga sp.]MDB5591288.1 penicillin-insensitive murein endopeptidase [Enterovirga sp.]
MRANRLLPLLLALVLAGPASGQEPGEEEPKALPRLKNPDDPATPAKELFGRKPKPASLEARAIGFYSRGCLAGAQALPVDGKTWQVMRLSRNRNWGHPDLIRFIEKMSARVPQINGWPGLLVGDISQPRGGPMLTGHASHQIGLDADIWLTPMPDRRLSRKEREQMSAVNLVREDREDVDPAAYTPAHMALIRAVSREPEVARIFVNPAIKRALCRDAGQDRAWLSKVRPIWGHNYHFHIRLACPEGQEGCRDQDPAPPGDGCGADLEKWLTPEWLFPRAGVPGPPLRMSALPKECREVLVSP